MAEPQAPEMDIVKMMSSFFPLIIMWGWGRLALDTTDPFILWGIRAIFLIVQLIQFGVILYVEKQIKKRSTEPEHAKVIKYVVPKKSTQPFGAEADPNVEPFEYTEKTVSEYDLEQVQPLKALMPLVITIGIHAYFNITQPLVIQTFTGPLRLFENKVLKMYLFGQFFERPFPAAEPGFMTSIFGQKSEKEKMDEWDQQQQTKVQSKQKKSKVVESKESNKKQD